MGAGREVQISLDGVRDKNLMQLKKLNTALFPVRYNDKYYADALASGEFTKLGSITPSGSFLFSFFFLHFLISLSCVWLYFVENFDGFVLFALNSYCFLAYHCALFYGFSLFYSFDDRHCCLSFYFSIKKKCK